MSTESSQVVVRNNTGRPPGYELVVDDEVVG